MVEHLSTFKCPFLIFNKQIVCKVNIHVFMYSKHILYWFISSKYVYIIFSYLIIYVYIYMQMIYYTFRLNRGLHLDLLNEVGQFIITFLLLQAKRWLFYIAFIWVPKIKTAYKCKLWKVVLNVYLYLLNWITQMRWMYPSVIPSEEESIAKRNLSMTNQDNKKRSCTNIFHKTYMIS